MAVPFPARCLSPETGLYMVFVKMPVLMLHSCWESGSEQVMSVIMGHILQPFKAPVLFHLGFIGFV